MNFTNFVVVVFAVFAVFAVIDVIEWEDQMVPKSEILRLIFQGRFLHGNVTLGSKFVFLHLFIFDFHFQLDKLIDFIDIIFFLLFCSIF